MARELSAKEKGLRESPARRLLRPVTEQPLLTPHSLTRTNEELVAFLSKNRDKNFLKSHGRDNSR